MDDSEEGPQKVPPYIEGNQGVYFSAPLFSSCCSFPGVQLAAPLLFFLLILLFLALLSPDPDPPPPQQCEANKKEQDSTHPWHHTLEEEI